MKKNTLYVFDELLDYFVKTTIWKWTHDH